MWTATDFVAWYAALAATAALLVQVLRWVKGGSRLHISIMPEGQLSTDTGEVKDNYLFAYAINRGETGTTLTHCELKLYPTFLSRLLDRATQTLNMPSDFPCVLDVGGVWTGMMKHDVELAALQDTGRLWVAISSTQRDRPQYYRVPVRHQP